MKNINLVLCIFLLIINFCFPITSANAQGQDPATLVEQGDNLLFQSDFAGAEEAYNAAIELAPDYAPTYAHRCFLRTFQLRFDEAFADCKKAVELEPQDAEGYIYLTRAYDWSGELEKAVEAGEQATALTPANGLAHSFLGEAYLDLGQMEEGEREVRLGVELAADVSETHRNLAYLYSKQGQMKSQLVELKTALGLAPNFVFYLSEIGLAYLNLGEAETALEYHQQALTIFREINHRWGEANTLDYIGWEYKSLGKYSQALDYFNQALEVFRNINDQGGIATTLNGIGSVYDNQGEDIQALKYYQESLDILQTIENLPLKADVLNNIGGIYYDLGDYSQASDYYQQALTLVVDLDDSNRQAILLANIGLVHDALGDHRQALDYYMQALDIQQQLGDLSGQAYTLNNIGGIYDDIGRFQEALNYFQQALDLARQINDPWIEARALNNIGDTYTAIGDFDQALTYMNRSLTIRRDIGDRDGEATTLNNIGTVYNDLDEHQKALEYIEKALTIWREIGGRSGEGTALHNLGTTYRYMKDFDQARNYYEQALMVEHEVYDREGEAITLNSIGVTFADQNRFSEALDYYQRALPIRQEVGDRLGEAVSLGNIGFAYEQQGNIAQAITFYQQAIDVFESVRSNIKVEELTTLFASQHIDTYEHLVSLLWNTGRFEEAFGYVERARARAFLDQLASGRVDFRAGTSAELLEREQALGTEIAALRQQLVTLRNRPSDEWNTDTIAGVESELAAREADYAQLLTELKLKSPEVVSLISVDVASLADVQSLLDANTTLVEYFVTKDSTLAFIITRNTFETVTIDVSRDDLTQTITTFRDFASLDSPYPASLKQLYAWLIAPLKDKLKTPLVGIIPHGVLHYLPFAALTDSEHYFGDDNVLFSLPSASTLRFLQAKRKPVTDTVLALGNPATTEPGLAPLHFAQQEAETIADLYGTQPLVDDKATETALRAQAGGTGIVHLAAHGEYNEYNPLFSAIYLAGDNENDGRLEVHEIYGLDLTQSTDLVVLSACQTQVGAVSAGDEVVGLTRAFLYAGSPTLIASLWNVDDEPTALLMERFYTHLREGMGKAQALQQAQSEVRVQYPHPYYWAAFVLTGDPGPVSAPVQPVEGLSQQQKALLLLAGLLAAITLVYMFVRRRNQH